MIYDPVDVRISALNKGQVLYEGVRTPCTNPWIRHCFAIHSPSEEYQSNGSIDVVVSTTVAHSRIVTIVSELRKNALVSFNRSPPPRMRS